MNRESTAASLHPKSMEFDFPNIVRSPAKTVRATKSVEEIFQNKEIRKMKEIPLDEDPTAIVYPATVTHKASEKASVNPQPSQSTASSPVMYTTSTSTSRPTVNARDNIERQKREQKTFNTLMGSAATFVLIGALLFLGLAGLGGYVLWSQIQKQSVTVALLETNMRQELAELQGTMEASNDKLQQDIDASTLKINRLTALAEEQKSTINSLNNSLENQRNQLHQEDAQIRQLRADINRITGRKRQ